MGPYARTRSNRAIVGELRVRTALRSERSSHGRGPVGTRGIIRDRTVDGENAVPLLRRETVYVDISSRYATILRGKAAPTLATSDTTPSRLVLSPRCNDYNGRRRSRKNDAKAWPEVVTTRRSTTP